MFAESLLIENYKLFKRFEIPHLKRINLFAGKNNTGKTALLEALRIAAAGLDVSVLISILNQRGYESYNANEAYDSLFNQDTLESNPSCKIQINGLFEIERNATNQHFNKYLLTDRKKDLAEGLNDLRNKLTLPVKPNDSLIYLPFIGSNSFSLEKLWDQIVLTPKEDRVIEVLRSTILPNLIRLDVKPNRTLVRLKNQEKPLPLQSLGDGAQRMLAMAIALVSAQNNALLIDEIEAGLHYSVVEPLWEMIFKYSVELNVQVFATTHSSDVIRQFTYLLEREENADLAAYFRLQKARSTGEIEAVPYSAEDLELSLETNLEPR